MAPFVVPMHKVQTWELLRGTLSSLFGVPIFAGSYLRITDDRGNSILPSVWQDLLESDMTIIVDTNSTLALDSPAKFQSPSLSFTPSSPFEKPKLHNRRGRSAGKTDSTREENSYRFAPAVSPLGSVIRDSLPVMSPPEKKMEGRSSRWLKEKCGGGEKRNTALSMFTGKGIRRPHTRAGLEESEPAPGIELLGEESCESRKKLSRRPSFQRVTRAMLFILTGGTTAASTPSSPLTSTPRRNSIRSRVWGGALTPDSNDSRSKQSSGIIQSPPPSLSKRRGVPSLPPLISPNLPFTTTRIVISSPCHLQHNSAPGEPRRSKSLGHLPVTNHTKHLSPTPTPAVPSIPRTFSIANPYRSRSLSRKEAAVAKRKSTISPPIPPREPCQELGVHSQFQTVGITKAKIQEMVGVIQREREMEMETETLRSARSVSSRSRSGTGDTSSTCATGYSSDCTSYSYNEKPLPKLPSKFTGHPPPPLEPPPMTATSTDSEWGRPATATVKKLIRPRVSVRRVGGGNKRAHEGMGGMI